MKTYILKSWVDVSVMKRQFFGTYAEVIRG